MYKKIFHYKIVQGNHRMKENTRNVSNRLVAKLYINTLTNQKEEHKDSSWKTDQGYEQVRHRGTINASKHMKKSWWNEIPYSLNRLGNIERFAKPSVREGLGNKCLYTVRTSMQSFGREKNSNIWKKS